MPAGCPYCGRTDGCEHLLLVVDVTFQTAEGGELMDDFERKWSEICERLDEEVQSSDFQELLDKVDYLSDMSLDIEFEGDPGMSSLYRKYYIDSPKKLESIKADFTSD